ncbi:hypothetical protein B0H16DRAFT_1477934 [Mycena metata]|uniref:Uncharacterized protein n=1 Tax=Mycena metata TaxID=1033252 RepID=A0AAD7H8P9_9AGAR|nr:hypothetical protein B0H16DRAFT_1477934 [Mycena metata]
MTILVLNHEANRTQPRPKRETQSALQYLSFGRDIGRCISAAEAVESFGSQAGRARAVFKDLKGRRVAKVQEKLIVHGESQDVQEYRVRTKSRCLRQPETSWGWIDNQRRTRGLDATAKGEIRVRRDTVHAKTARQLEAQGDLKKIGTA